MTWTHGDIDGVGIKKLVQHSDVRGWLSELFRSDELPPDLMPAMAYVSVTLPHTKRGPHEHSVQTDIFCFVGPGHFKIRLWDNRKHSPTYGKMFETVVGENNPTLIIVPPGVVHGYVNDSDVPAWVFNCPNRLFAGFKRSESVDETRHEDSVSSPFQLDS
ncbi:MAG: dTDP-4-dehydrorhamnose 3,5-epimerase family protein [Lentisphaerae bacterium]|nr:dTDP-4-dehydrorhamnose 3,5-epimerase family protein [Lentisphaerota bacterium]